MSWTSFDMPDQNGNVVIITGANSGLGLESTRAFAYKGATVIMACRNLTKANAARDQLLAELPNADLRIEALDLGDLASVRAFAERINADADIPRIDVLMNNAGVMAIPYSKTKDGFETQIGVNHLGHFALTGLLLEKLQAADHARIVNVSSLAHRPGQIHFDDLHGEKSYKKWDAYSQSKLANVLFTRALHQRLVKARSTILTAVAHPGYAATNLQFVGPQQENSSFMTRFMGLANRVAAQDAAQGALPQLYAATAPDVVGNDFIGPANFFQMWGPPRKVLAAPQGRDDTIAEALWERSVEETGVDYHALNTAAAK